MKTIFAALLLPLCTAFATAGEVPGRFLLTSSDGREKSFHVAAVYNTGMRVRERETGDTLFIKWDQLDETKTFKRYPELRAAKMKAKPVPAAVDGRKINITARWPANWSATETSRKLTVTVRHMDPAPSGESIFATLEIYHVINGRPNTAQLHASAAPAVEAITLPTGGSITKEIDLPVAPRTKSIGGWAIRFWHEGRVVASAESAPGMLAALQPAKLEPRPKN